tara:strand:+ start:542 stop:1240 length:699 start_codon:yes stop_codon:yes gene_type:complete
MKKDTLYKILQACDQFKHNTYYWDHDVLTPEENDIRNYPAPWIKKTKELFDIINGNVIVEIGSTRMELTQKCIDYYNNSDTMTSKDAPPCCQDGHSTYFWAKDGAETYTVDIDSWCHDVICSQYKHHILEPIPDNLHLHIPEDGINFLTQFPHKIDLLYLDGWDKGTDQYAEKHLEAFLAAKDKLAEDHIISIDDTDFNTDSAGKDRLLTPHLLSAGYIKVLWGRQTVFIKI